MKGETVFSIQALRAASQRRRVRFGIKLLLAAALIVWLGGKGGWGQVLRSLEGVSPAWFGFSVFLYLAGQSLCSWKWSVLAGSLGFRRPLRFYWVNYLGAMFPSLFLPTTVGGDVFRVVALARGEEPADAEASPAAAEGSAKVRATVSVLADRGTGLLALVWIAAAAVATPTIHLHALAEHATYALAAALTLGFALPFFVRPAFARRGLIGRALACWDHPRELLLSLAAALGFQLLVCVIYFCFGQAIDLKVAPGAYFLVCPIASVAAMSPITFSGLGERVAALVILFQFAGVGSDRAVAIGLEWTAMATIASLIGGLVLFVADRSGGWVEEAAG